MRLLVFQSLGLVSWLIFEYQVWLESVSLIGFVFLVFLVIISGMIIGIVLEPLIEGISLKVKIISVLCSLIVGSVSLGIIAKVISVSVGLR